MTPRKTRSAMAWVRNACAVVFVFVAASMCGAQGMNNGIMSPPASARPPGLKGVGIEQHLNEALPLDAQFLDESGNRVKLGDYFGKRPVILSLVYYRCPMLCSEVLSGLESALRVLKFDVGNEFDVVTVSFDPTDTPAMAAAKKAEYIRRYGRPYAAQGWHFLTGTQDSIDRVTKAAGFGYQYDPRIKQFAHAAAIAIITPQGKIAQYYYGVEFAPKDLRLGLVEAADNKIGNPIDQVLLYCYHYDPDAGRYGAIVSRILKISGLATVLVLGSFLVLMMKIGSQPKATLRASSR